MKTLNNFTHNLKQPLWHHVSDYVYDWTAFHLLLLWGQEFRPPIIYGGLPLTHSPGYGNSEWGPPVKIPLAPPWASTAISALPAHEKVNFGEACMTCLCS